MRIKNLFKKAKKHSPCVIFIDEIDAVGGHRIMDHGYYRLTINELLTQMDGFDNQHKVIVIGKNIYLFLIKKKLQLICLIVLIKL